MTGQPAKVKLGPLCGSCDDGWLVDPDTLLPVRRCPCRHDSPTNGEHSRDHALASTVAANPDAMREALAIIRRAALTRDTFSSNSVRHEMVAAGVPSPTIGAAFRQAAKDRVIRKAGYEPSTDPATHAHPVVQWQSCIFRPGQSVAS